MILQMIGMEIGRKNSYPKNKRGVAKGDFFILLHPFARYACIISLGMLKLSDKQMGIYRNSFTDYDMEDFEGTKWN